MNNANSVNVAEQATAEQGPVPPVHVDWLNPAEQQHIQDNHVGEEVNRRLRMDHEQSVQDRQTMHTNCNSLTKSTVPVLTPQDAQTTEEVEASATESDGETNGTPLTTWNMRNDSPSKVRRQPGRR